MSPKVTALIALATNAATSREEARTAAMEAVRLMVKEPLNGGPRAKQRASRGVNFKEIRGLGIWDASYHVAHQIWLYLAKHPECIISVSEVMDWVSDCISEESQSTFQTYLHEELSFMTQRGLLISKRGRKGGYMIAESDHEI